jgi:hypothetical protein
LELECCVRFCVEDEVWSHSLQILSGGWNAIKYNSFVLRKNFGATHCRSFLEAGKLQKNVDAE